MFNREDIIWAVGLFEGEGCITEGHRRKSTYKRRWRLVLAMTDEDVVRRFASIVKFGNIYVVERGIGSDGSFRKRIWYWECAKRKHVYALLAAFYLWLGNRRKAKAREVLMELSKPIPVKFCKRGHLRSADNLTGRHCKTCRHDSYEMRKDNGKRNICASSESNGASFLEPRS